MHLFFRRIRPAVYIMALSILAFSLWGTGCGSTLVQDPQKPDFCVGDADCGANSRCLNQTCVVTTTTQHDAGLPWDGVPNHFEPQPPDVPVPGCIDGQAMPCQVSKPTSPECNAGKKTCAGGVWGECNARKDAPEECNGLDDNCDGQIDETFAQHNAPCIVPKLFGLCAKGKKRCLEGKIVCEQIVKPSEELCDGLDNDCNGKTDDLSRSCYTGPENTEGIGPCKAGIQNCTNGSWGGCGGQILPKDEECNGKDDNCDGKVDNNLIAPACDFIKGVCAGAKRECGGESGWKACSYSALYEATETKCDGKDNDCDGVIDEGCGCKFGESRACGSKVGACKEGTQRCVSGVWENTCHGEVLPQIEVCNGIDDNCDGSIDESFPEQGNSCVTNQPGACKDGKPICDQGKLICKQSNQPSAEICDNKDNDCDGQIDNGFDYNGQPQGKPCEEGVGACKVSGTIVCSSDGTRLVCSASAGSPSVETCNGIDDNCNGQIDEQITRSCKIGVSKCDGTQTCLGANQWSPCIPNVALSREICDGKDNNCDGNVDESFPEEGRQCNTGKKGPCQAGTQACINGVLTCKQVTTGVPEVCDGIDNDCNGIVDDTPVACSCLDGKTQPCYNGPSGTSNVGSCKPGEQICLLGKWQACVNEITPKDEECNGLDDNCDGSTDENVTQACYTGPDGCAKQGDGSYKCKGACQAGFQKCIGPKLWSTCQQDVKPRTEICDNTDNDCDGHIDEICGPKHSYIIDNEVGLDALNGFKNLRSGPNTGAVSVDSELNASTPCSSQVLIVTTQSVFPSGAAYKCAGKQFDITTFRNDAGDRRNSVLQIPTAPIPFHALSPTDGVYGYVECTSTTCSLKWTNNSNAVKLVLPVFPTEGIVKLDSDFCKDEMFPGGTIVKKPFFATLYGSSPGYIQTWTAGTQNPPQGQTWTPWGKCEVQTFSGAGVRVLRSFVFWFPPKSKSVWASVNDNATIHTEIADFDKEFTTPWQFSLSFFSGGAVYTAQHAAWMAPSVVSTTPLFDGNRRGTPYLLPFTIGGASNSNVTLSPYKQQTLVQNPFVRSKVPFAIHYGRTP